MSLNKQFDMEESREALQCFILLNLLLSSNQNFNQNLKLKKKKKINLTHSYNSCMNKVQFISLTNMRLNSKQYSLLH
jgi:hypothetical protein